MKSILLFVLGQAVLAAAAARVPTLIERQQNTSFAGVNSFFLHAFQEYVSYIIGFQSLLLTDDCRSDRLDVLDAIQAANLKVLRLFISETFPDFKRTGSIYMPDIEPETVGVYNDTQLETIDQLMVEAHARGKSARFPPLRLFDCSH